VEKPADWVSGEDKNADATVSEYDDFSICTQARTAMSFSRSSNRTARVIG
jgi:hypothetical protein